MVLPRFAIPRGCPLVCWSLRHGIMTDGCHPAGNEAACVVCVSTPGQHNGSPPWLRGMRSLSSFLVLRVTLTCPATGHSDQCGHCDQAVIMSSRRSQHMRSAHGVIHGRLRSARQIPPNDEGHLSRLSQVLKCRYLGDLSCYEIYVTIFGMSS